MLHLKELNKLERKDIVLSLPAASCSFYAVVDLFFKLQLTAVRFQERIKLLTIIQWHSISDISLGLASGNQYYKLILSLLREFATRGTNFLL